MPGAQDRVGGLGVGDDVMRVSNDGNRKRDFYTVTIASLPKSNKSKLIASGYGHFHSARFDNCTYLDLVYVGDFGSHGPHLIQPSDGCNIFFGFFFGVREK